MDLNFTQNHSASISSLADFEASLKKKYYKKNQIQQISEFNSKDLSNNPIRVTSSASFSQSDFKSSQKQAQLAEKQDFFEEEGKKLLGKQQSTKQLNLSIVLADLLIHVFLLLQGLGNGSFRIVMIGDLVMLAFNICLLSEKRLRLSNQLHHRLHRFYQFALIVSMACLFINLGYSALVKQNKSSIWNLLQIVLDFVGIGCEIKLRKQTKYVLFMTQQLNKKQSPEEMDLTDQI